jgi:hypothetical protein
MSRTRSLVFAAWSFAALAVPAFASADTAQTAARVDSNGVQAQAQAPASQNAPACDCANCAAQHQHVATAAATRARRHRRARPATTAMMNIDSRITRDVADGCQYRADARGHYRGAFLGTAPQGRIRDVHVVADTSLTCNGHVMRRQSQRWDLPSMTRGELAQAMHDRLAIQVPGSACNFSSNYGFNGGNLAVRSADSSCATGEETAALRNFQSPSQRFVTPTARGGGQRDPSSFDARTGTH